MTSPLLNRLAVGRSPALLYAGLGLVGGALFGAANAYNLKTGVAVGVALLLVVIVLRRPANAAVLALVATFAVQRVGSASLTPGTQGGVSYSDALLALAMLLGLPAVLGTSELRRLRIATAGVAVYLAFLLPTVILNPSGRAFLEWAHRLTLVGGALVVGAWIAREGLRRAALRWLVAVAVGFAVLAIRSSAVNGFHAANVLGLNKNFLGAMLGSVFVLVAIAARHIELTPRTQAIAIVILGAGLLAAQSRGAALATVAALLVALVLDPRGHSRRVWLVSFLVGIVLAVFAFVSIRAQLNQTTEDKYNSSIGVRFNVEKVTREIWRTSPTVGVGLKYFNTGHYGYYAQAANNDVDNELAESGIFGLAGFVALQGLATVAGARRRRHGTLVTAAVGMVLGQLLHGMVDIYWTAGVVSLPFIVLGMALATDTDTDATGSAPRAEQRALASR